MGLHSSGARRVHPVIVAWSIRNRPLLPGPSRYSLMLARCGSQSNPPGIRSFIVDLCLLYERQPLRNQSNSSLDGAPPFQVRSSCQNSKLNEPTPEAMADNAGNGVDDVVVGAGRMVDAVAAGA